MIRERQMRLYDNVARFPASDPAGRICPVGRPYHMWLRQIDRHFAGVGMGHVAAWRMAIRRPKEYRSEVDAATCYHGACSH